MLVTFIHTKNSSNFADFSLTPCFIMRQLHLLLVRETVTLLPNNNIICLRYEKLLFAIAVKKQVIIQNAV